MGFNSVVLVLNDRLSQIRDDKEFGAKLVNAVLNAAVVNKSYEREVIPSQTTVLGCEHADTMQIWAIGGNTGRLLGRGRWADSDVELLAKLADKYGYFLTPKERRKGK
jgi:hypothetical protein